MTKTKEELEQSIVMLEERVESNKTMSAGYEADLVEAKKDLANVNKPELTASQFDDIHEAIEKGIDEYDFSDTDNFDKEFGIDYDGRVTLENFEISNSQDLVEMIVAEVSKLFVETEELDTTEAGNKQQYGC